MLLIVVLILSVSTACTTQTPIPVKIHNTFPNQATHEPFVVQYADPLQVIGSLLTLDKSISIINDWNQSDSLLYMMKALSSNLSHELVYLKEESKVIDSHVKPSYYIHKIARQLVHILFKYRTMPFYEYKHRFITNWYKYAQLLVSHPDARGENPQLIPWEMLILDRYDSIGVTYLDLHTFHILWSYLPIDFKQTLNQINNISYLDANKASTSFMATKIFEYAINHELAHVREMMKRVLQVCCKMYLHIDDIPQIVLVRDKIYTMSLPPINHKQRILELARRVLNASMASILTGVTYLLVNNNFDDQLIQDLDNRIKLIVSELGMVIRNDLRENRVLVGARLIQGFAILAVHLLYRNHGFIPNRNIELFSTWSNLVNRLMPYMSNIHLLDSPHPWEKYLLLMYEKYNIPDCQSIQDEISALQLNLNDIFAAYNTFTPHTRRILDEAVHVTFGFPDTFNALYRALNDEYFLLIYPHITFMLTRLVMYCTILNATPDKCA